MNFSSINKNKKLNKINKGNFCQSITKLGIVNKLKMKETSNSAEDFLKNLLY